MSLKVYEALKIAGLREAKVVAGMEGMNKLIEHVTVLEVPDITKWLNGNELILTSGYAISRNDIEQEKLIEELAKKGTAALVIKVHRFLDTIPPAMLEAANKHQLPIIELKPDITYLDIIKPILAAIIDKETQQVQKLLTKIDVSGESMAERVALLSNYLKKPLAIIDKQFNILSLSNDFSIKVSLFKSKIGNLANISEGYSVSIGQNNYFLFPLSIDDTVEGYLILVEDCQKLKESIVHSIRSATPFFTLDLLQRKTLKKMERNFLNQFIEDLLLGHIKSEDVAKRRAKFLGLATKVNYVILVADISTKDKHLIDQLELVTLQDNQSLLVFTEGNNLMILVSFAERRDFNGLVKSLYQKMCDIWCTSVTVGVGEPFSDLTKARKSYLEASEALEFGNKVWQQGECIYFSNIGISRLLYSLGSVNELKKYIPKGLKELVKYDQEFKTNLVGTLQCYLINAGNSKKTAKELYIHYKTLQYRLDRISEISNINLNSGEHRLEYHLGLKILDICQKR